MTRSGLRAAVLPALLLVPSCAARARPPEPPAPAPPLRNVVRWTTASEVANFGYNVYRGTSETGPWTKLNAGIIPGAGTTDVPSRYRFVDETVEAGVTYYYYVESVSMSGVARRFTPIHKTPPRGPEPPAEDPGPDGSVVD